MSFVPPPPDRLIENFHAGQRVKLPDVEHWSPLISYQYLSLRKTQFCFDHDALEPREFVKYFEMVKIMASSTIGDLIYNAPHEWHCHAVNNPSKILLKELKAILDVDHIPYTNLPFIGQFALYTEPIVDMANKSRAPRIFFLISTGGVFNILFLDLYHKLAK